MTDSFIIVVSIIFSIQILMLCSFIRLCPSVKAEKVSKFCWKYKLLFSIVPRALDCNGKIVEVSSYAVFYVEGNSMKDYKIFDGQQVFVSKYLSEKEKESITDYPVLVFHIYKSKYQSQYKLRKFVCYITTPQKTEWEDIYNDFKSRIKISKEEFITELKNKKEKISNPQELYILSETYDEDENRYHYSLHPVKSIYAKVLYSF